MMHQYGFRFFIGLAMVVSLGACSVFGPLRQDERAKGYRFSKPGPRWQKRESPKVEHVFASRDSAALLGVNSVCRRYETSSLESLARELSSPVRSREVLDQSVENVDGREALLQKVTGTLDGVVVEMWIAVLRKNNCLFDFQVTRSPALTPEDEADFLTLLRSFEFSKGEP
jgi:hypothetical protein